VKSHTQTHTESAPLEHQLLPYSQEEVRQMLYYTWIFLVIALIAGLFGFGIVASTAAGIAKILFFVFLVIFLISLIGGRRAV
jgi:uncharacterized membrane protein YtjA (UPF0391 family)